MRVTIQKISSGFMLAVTMVAFQNCGSGFQAASRASLFGKSVFDLSSITVIDGRCYDREQEMFIECPPGMTPTPTPTATPATPTPTATPVIPTPTPTPTPTTPTPTPTPVQAGEGLNVPIMSTCNVQVRRHLNAQTAGEMLVSFYTNSSGATPICTVATSTVRSTLLNEKRISLSAAAIQAQCPQLPTGQVWATILPQNNIWANNQAEFYGWFAGIFPLNVVKTSAGSPTVTMDTSVGDINGNVKNGKPLVLWGNAGQVAGCDQNDSPLVVNVNRDGKAPTQLKLTAPLDGILFDILGLRSMPYAHTKKRISWFADEMVARDNYFLVIPNRANKVEGIEQMFGNNTSGPDRMFADNGFEALKKYDGLRRNGRYNSTARDGKIDRNDDVFTHLRLWSDENLDGESQANELYTLDQLGIESINLDYDENYREADIYHNEIHMKSDVTMKDGSSSLIYDLWFRTLDK